MKILSVIVFFMLTADAAAQQAPVSLGDLSRQTEAGRATGQKAKKSYTNKDLNAVPKAEPQTEQASPDRNVSASTAERVPAGEPAKTGQEKVDTSASGANMPEEHWRQRSEYLRAEYLRAQQRMDKLKTVPQPESLPARSRLEQEFVTVRQMVDGLNKQWDRLAESARVAKVPGDWIGEKPVVNQ